MHVFRALLMVTALLVVFLTAVLACNAKNGPASARQPQLETAYFAEGCFWKTQHVFSKVQGIVKARVGYMGGQTQNPTYKDVCAHDTGHAETLKVVFDPTKVSYQKLLQVFWGSHDPTTANRQGPDVGTQYRSAIFYTTAAQKDAAFACKAGLDAEHKFLTPIVTEIFPATKFYDAEEYHQDYYAKHGAVCY